jgi:hypothetical protein
MLIIILFAFNVLILADMCYNLLALIKYYHIFTKLTREKGDVFMKKEKPATKLCKYCKTEIPYDAKVCPQCRRKQGSALKTVIIVIIALGLLGSCFGGGSKSTKSDTKATTSAAAETTVAETEPEIVYTPATVTEMMAALKDNAMKASDTYKGQYLEVTGTLKVIDSDGKYIGLYGDGSFEVVGVQCYIKTDEQKKAVMDMSIGDTVTLRGK